MGPPQIETSRVRLLVNPLCGLCGGPIRGSSLISPDENVPRFMSSYETLMALWVPAVALHEHWKRELHRAGVTLQHTNVRL